MWKKLRLTIPISQADLVNMFVSWLFFTLLPFAHAGTYYIDRSCSDRHDEIDKGIQNAFAMAKSASAAINKPVVEPDTLNNIQSLFGNVPVNEATGLIKAIFSGGNAVSRSNVVGMLSYDSPTQADNLESLTEKDVVRGSLPFVLNRH